MARRLGSHHTRNLENRNSNTLLAYQKLGLDGRDTLVAVIEAESFSGWPPDSLKRTATARADQTGASCVSVLNANHIGWGSLLLWSGRNQERGGRTSPGPAGHPGFSSFLQTLASPSAFSSTGQPVPSLTHAKR